MGFGAPLGAAAGFSGGGGVSEQAGRLTGRRVAEDWREPCGERTKEGGEGAKARGREREELPTEQQSGSGANLINREPLRGADGTGGGVI